MINNVLLFLAKFAIGGKILSAIGWAHNALDGKRSEIVVGVFALVHALKVFGVIPAEQADSIEKNLLPILPLVLADRASKIKGMVDNLIPKP